MASQYLIMAVGAAWTVASSIPSLIWAWRVSRRIKSLEKAEAEREGGERTTLVQLHKRLESA